MTADPDWQPRITNDFPHFVGPILERLENGGRIFAFRADARHANDRGVVHGGMLMTFADQAFGELVLDSVKRRLCATVQLNTHFIAAVQIGDLVEARGEIVRGTRSLVFMRGLLTIGERTVASIDGIWKVLHGDG
jgi:acyl-coenzyme A thioesterase 13